MKIIREGRDPDLRLWRGKCYRCKAVVEAEERELIVTDDQRDGPSGHAACPACGKADVFFSRVERP